MNSLFQNMISWPVITALLVCTGVFGEAPKTSSDATRGGTSPPEPAAVIPSATPALVTGVISGRVVLPESRVGRRSARGQLYRNRLSRSSPTSHAHEGKDGAHANVIVSAHPLSFDAHTSPLPDSPRIEQRNATFLPHVTPVTVGTTVLFINDDPFYHNVFSVTPGARFNIGRRPKGDVFEQEITYVEVTGLGEIRLFCDIHAQMSAVILSLDTPYYVRADSAGSYRLEGLPVGRYELRVFSPEHGTLSREVAVDEDGATDMQFAFAS